MIHEKGNPEFAPYFISCRQTVSRGENLKLTRYNNFCDFDRNLSECFFFVIRRRSISIIMILNALENDPNSHVV